MSTTPNSPQSEYEGDEKLLRQYIQSGSSAAFDRIYRHHGSFVYSVCLREVRNPQMAEDATQVVFVILARKAAGLRSGTALASWLFQTSCFVCKDLRRQESRRRQREEIAARERRNEEMQQEQDLWSGVEPLLNDVLLVLNQKERTAILLRFFEGLSLKQTGHALGISEDAARMQVSRALNKMHRHLAKSGIALSVVALTDLLVQPPVRAVPPGLAAPKATFLQTPYDAHIRTLAEGVLRTMRLYRWKSAALTAGVVLIVLTVVVHPYSGATPRFALAIPFLRQAANQQQAEEVFDRVRTRLEKAQTISGRLLQQSYGQTVPLRFKLKKPNLYAVQGKDGEFYYDGTTRWSYTGANKQVLKEPAITIRTVPLLWGFDPFLFGEKGLYPVKRYAMEPFADTQAATATLDVPGPTEFKVFADPKTGMLLGWTQKFNEIRIQFRYVDITFDAPIQAAEFSWTPPEDATPEGQPLRPSASLSVGATAPDFEAQTLEGRSVRLSEMLKGTKGVLLNFWLTDYAYCQEELQRLENRYADLKKQGFVLLSINCGDSPEAIRKLVASGKLTFPIAQNGAGANNAAERYGVYAYPTLYRIGPDSKVQGQYISIQDRRLTSVLNPGPKP